MLQKSDILFLIIKKLGCKSKNILFWIRSNLLMHTISFSVCTFFITIHGIQCHFLDRTSSILPKFFPNFLIKNKAPWPKNITYTIWVFSSLFLVSTQDLGLVGRYFICPLSTVLFSGLNVPQTYLYLTIPFQSTKLSKFGNHWAYINHLASEDMFTTSGFRLLLGPVTSPSLSYVFKSFSCVVPKIFHHYL